MNDRLFDYFVRRLKQITAKDKFDSRFVHVGFMVDKFPLVLVSLRENITFTHAPHTHLPVIRR
jgi:hypothetical protein